jgi:hypothetical protein
MWRREKRLHPPWNDDFEVGARPPVHGVTLLTEAVGVTSTICKPTAWGVISPVLFRTF